MRKVLVVSLVGLALALGACGGGKKGGKGAAAGGGQSKADEAAETFGKTDDGRPGWIMRGNVAQKMPDGRRVFFGVGVASGIKNPSLLRSTADNRARNELAKIFEVYSASLMKDYMNSGGEQTVEQAVKTAASSSLKGTEVVDRYIGSDGSLYALASLDLETVKKVLEAEAAGAAKSFVTKVDVDDIFDAHGKKPPPPPPPPRVAAQDVGSGPASEPKGDGSKVRERSGKKPAWIDGEDANFPYNTYLCGVGFAKDRTGAENGAYAALARIFIANVSSMSKDFMGAYSATGAQSLEVQSSETLTKVSTAKIFSGVQLMEVWAGEGYVYGLACLDRAKAANILGEQIAALDEEAGRHLERAGGADKAAKVGYLAKAMDAILTREAHNTELRIVNVDGSGIAGPYSHADVAAAFEAAVEALKVGVRIEGPYEDEFNAYFVSTLTKRGWKISDLSAGGDEDQDVLVLVKIRMDDSGKGTKSAQNIQFATAVIVVEVKNVQGGKIITAFEESKSRGHRNLQEAERSAVKELSKIITNKIGKGIDDAMKGK